MPLLTAGRRTLLAKSCIMCGVLHAAKRYQKIGGVYYNSYCHDCRNSMAAPVTKAGQKNSIKTAKRSGRPWSQEDLKGLEKAEEEGLTAKETAKRLGRTVYAVSTMKAKMKEEIK